MKIGRLKLKIKTVMFQISYSWGGIEPGTTELAQVIAEKGGYNYFSFKGIRSKGNNELHVTSTHYDNKQALDLVKKVKEQ